MFWSSRAAVSLKNKSFQIKKFQLKFWGGVKCKLSDICSYRQWHTVGLYRHCCQRLIDISALLRCGEINNMHELNIWLKQGWDHVTILSVCTFRLTVENWNNIQQCIETMVSYIFLSSIKTGTFCKHDTGWFKLLIAQYCICVMYMNYIMYTLCINMEWLYDLWQKKMKKQQNEMIKYAKLHKLWYLWTTSQHTVPFEDSFMLKRSEI